MADITHNHVSNTDLRGIDMGEMSMGTISHNTVVDSKGVGILCLDHSECDIARNTISRAQLPIQEQYFAHAKLHKNTIERMSSHFQLVARTGIRASSTCRGTSRSRTGTRRGSST